MMHEQSSELAGQTVQIVAGRLAGRTIVIEDWWDRIANKSWMHCVGNPACIEYAMTDFHAPLDDEVIYGKVGSFGVLVHVTYLMASPAQGSGAT